MHPGWPQEKIKDPERETWALSGNAMGALGANEHPVTGRTQEDIGWSSALHSVLAKDRLWSHTGLGWNSGSTVYWLNFFQPHFTHQKWALMASISRGGCEQIVHEKG